jgi:hypothetical protein
VSDTKLKFNVTDSGQFKQVLANEGDSRLNQGDWKLLKKYRPCPWNIGQACTSQEANRHCDTHSNDCGSCRSKLPIHYGIHHLNTNHTLRKSLSHRVCAEIMPPMSRTLSCSCNRLLQAERQKDGQLQPLWKVRQQMWQANNS